MVERLDGHTFSRWSSRGNQSMASPPANYPDRLPVFRPNPPLNHLRSVDETAFKNEFVQSQLFH
ncbi:hypothetical protein J6590_009496 [Homalodisca vitripennis]|nr:hypothetical protein J6590_009496 [Homalodisca vitripennis]